MATLIAGFPWTKRYPVSKLQFPPVKSCRLSCEASFYCGGLQAILTAASAASAFVATSSYVAKGREVSSSLRELADLPETDA